MKQPIGQARLVNIINNYTMSTLPKALLFIGDMGCGKKTFAKYLADKLQFDFIEIERINVSFKMSNTREAVFNRDGSALFTGEEAEE